MNVNINNTDPVFSIGVVAEKFNISVHTLRLYEAEGLIIPYKTKTGRRRYSHSDIQRIGCIRDMIESKGLNFSGIRSLLALIPCWELRPCTEEARKNCDAYTNTSLPCWSAKHKGDLCTTQLCRDCHVYQGLAKCSNFKEYMKNISYRGRDE
jgi:MerR family transcriptional regulator/heat shock protein HspR